MLRLTLTIPFVLISFLALQVQGLAIETRADKPAFLNQTSKALLKKFNSLPRGLLLPKKLQSKLFDYNDEIWFDQKFSKLSDYLSKYRVNGNTKPTISSQENPFEGYHPYYKASRLPGIENDMILSSYVASQSPLRHGKGEKTLYWDIVWQKARNDTVLVSLLPSNSRSAMEKDDALIPTSPETPLDFYEIEKAKGDLTCNVKYTLHLEETESHHDGRILYHRLRLVKDGESRKLNFFHYTEWPNKQALSVENMRQLIELVDTKHVAGNTMFVNCLIGLGRTLSFIMAWDISKTAEKFKRTGKNFFDQKGAKGVDPIEQYLRTLRNIRNDVIENMRQFEFLYTWSNHVRDTLHG